MAENIQF